MAGEHLPCLSANSRKLLRTPPPTTTMRREFDLTISFHA